MQFLCEAIYRIPEVVVVGSLNVLVKSLKTVLDEIYL